ncbi:MAG: hypothetical protein LHV69_10335 [Elusimicrobia bacterium]|nr:hypothetical protein [Candidatus Obscuribacterium magneticum]
MKLTFIRSSVFSFCLSCLFLFCAHLQSQGFDTSWLRTRTLANALNPNLSVIGDFTANAGPMKDAASNRFSLRETEVGLQASVDPYARADFFVSFPEGEAVELEEGYASLLSLPWNLKARGGKFRANFGRLNMTHPHEYSTIDTPIVLSSFLGEEGLNDTGAEISRIFAPFGLFLEVSYSFLNGLGAHEHEEDAVTTTVTDTNGNVVTVAVHRPEETVERQLRNFAHLSKIRFYKDFTDTTNIDLGFSGALHQPKERKETKMGAIDVTLRWKPIREGLYRSFLWRTEAFYSDRKLMPETDLLTGAVTAAERRLHRRGWYSNIEVQPAQRWRFGVRADYVESPEADIVVITLEDQTVREVETSITRAVNPYITFTLSEFNRFRVQYQYQQVPGDDEEHRVFFQWVVVLGPHGAHPF